MSFEQMSEEELANARRAALADHILGTGPRSWSRDMERILDHVMELERRLAACADPNEYFTCPRCGCHRFGVSALGDEPPTIECHGDDGCRFRMEQAAWEALHPHPHNVEHMREHPPETAVAR